LREPPLMRPAARSCSICIRPWIHPSKHACMHPPDHAIKIE
jgi:hypothetical protein